MGAPDEKQVDPPTATPEAASQTTVTKPVPTVDDDSDPDFDDLDDVLDQFSANAPASTTQPSRPDAQPSQSTPTASGPGRPPFSDLAADNESEPPLPSGPKPGESEEDFLTRLSAEMSTMLGSLAADSSESTQSPEDLAKMGKELEEFTYKMEKEGIKPEDLLKALLGGEEGDQLADLAKQERDRLDKGSLQPSSSSSSSQQPQPLPTPPTSSTTKPDQRPASSSSAKPPAKSFEDTIRSTMSRLGESDKSATTAAQKQSSTKSEEDMLADMLRALESSGSGDPNASGGEEGLSKMFLDMMQQLTHKDLLYEPMKELNEQYPDWLRQNKEKLSTDEFARYGRQAAIVSDITRKFEEPGFSDEDPACREFIWEKMQKMQEEGAPPEELVKNPLPGADMGGIPGLGGGGGELPEGLSKELEEGCATQ